MEIVQGTHDYRYNPAVLLDMSGCDSEFALRDNCHTMIVPLPPTTVSDLPGEELIPRRHPLAARTASKLRKSSRAPS